MGETMENLNDIIRKCFDKNNIIKIILSNKRKKTLDIKKVDIRPVIIKGEQLYQFEFFYDNKATHLNLDSKTSTDKIIELMDINFKQCNIFTSENDINILASKLDKPRIVRHKPTMEACVPSHDNTKNYIIEDGKPCDFLIELNVMTKDGNVIPKHYSKFRQINRYLEIIDDIYEYLPKNRTIKIIDFGCGKAYLTFAIYHYLKELKNLDVQIIGLDLKKGVIDFCNEKANCLGYTGLKFLLGDIVEYKSDYADLVVTLHACDTATDFALMNAVKWNTKVILSVPCCQHELFNQISNDIHEPMLKHGILKDRLTEYLTDGLRGLKLESKGYDVSMIEFTSLEHTSKNILIKAIKTGHENDAKAQNAINEYAKLKDFYQVNPSIDLL
ncbi:MAG TPA: SAM-dependent methyltransferase [Anaerovoracaceae bacterium]|nr:SAM-dependent methyltransferase [Anaerovoracaceae bacterium]